MPDRDARPTVRAATSGDLAACERIWRDALNDYQGRLGQPEIPADNPGLRRLHEHALATDPERFRVATRDGRVVAFGSAVERGRVWFLSMLFVDPAEQARGLGRGLLRELLPSDPGATLATATDSAQPVSNGLYASFGITPRLPLLDAIGRPRPGWRPPPLPDGIVASPLTASDPAAVAGTSGTPELPMGVIDEIDALDRAVLSFDHPADHRFARRERPAGFAFRDAAGRLVGYGYTSEVGRLGPLAVRDPGLMGPALGHLLTAVEPRGASAVWLPGAASTAIEVALDAGLRFEGFPVLLCWNRPFADFERYVPISPGLL